MKYPDDESSKFNISKTSDHNDTMLSTFYPVKNYENDRKSLNLKSTSQDVKSSNRFRHTGDSEYIQNFKNRNESLSNSQKQKSEYLY